MSYRKTLILKPISQLTKIDREVIEKQTAVVPSRIMTRSTLGHIFFPKEIFVWSAKSERTKRVIESEPFITVMVLRK